MIYDEKLMNQQKNIQTGKSLTELERYESQMLTLLLSVGSSGLNTSEQVMWTKTKTATCEQINSRCLKSVCLRGWRWRYQVRGQVFQHWLLIWQHRGSVRPSDVVLFDIDRRWTKDWIVWFHICVSEDSPNNISASLIKNCVCVAFDSSQIVSVSVGISPVGQHEHFKNVIPCAP